MHLAAHDQRVHRLAEIVADDSSARRRPCRCRDRPRPRPCGSHWGRCARRSSATSAASSVVAGWPARRLAALRRGERDDVDAAIGADDGEAAVGEGDVGERRFQRLGRGLLAFVDHRIGGEQDRLAFGIQAARAAGAAADRDRVGVALADADLVAVDAEPVGGQLHIGGLVPLAGRLRADIDIDEAVIGETDFRAFGRIAAGRFQVVGQADAAPLAALRRRRRGGRRSRRSPSSAAPHPARCGNRRCRRSCRPAWRAASPTAAPCCGGAIRCGRCSVRAPRRRPAARPGSCSRAGRRRDRRQPARCW